MLVSLSDCGQDPGSHRPLRQLPKHPGSCHHRLHWHTQIWPGADQLLHRPLLSLLLHLPTGVPHQQHTDCGVSKYRNKFFVWLFIQIYSKWYFHLFHEFPAPLSRWRPTITMELSLMHWKWLFTMWVYKLISTYTLKSFVSSFVSLYKLFPPELRLHLPVSGAFSRTPAENQDLCGGQGR